MPHVIGTAEAAAEMGGYTTAGVIYRIKILQVRHPDLQIVLPRSKFGRWRINLEQLREAVRCEQNPTLVDLSDRVCVLESDIKLLTNLLCQMKRKRKE